MKHPPLQTEHKQEENTHPGFPLCPHSRHPVHAETLWPLPSEHALNQCIALSRHTALLGQTPPSLTWALATDA